MRVSVLWLASSAIFNLVWEIAQLPLYTLYREASRAEIAYAIAHCAVGDVLIATAAYAVAAVMMRSLAWPLSKPWPGAIVAVTVAFAYTVFSEWLNMYVRKSWAYSDLMPQVLGIGASPMLQWLVIPIAATLATIWLSARERRLGG